MSKKRMGKNTVESRPPTENKRSNPTARPPLISCGKRERDILAYIKNSIETRFNRRQYARQNNIPRTTVKDILDRLINMGLITSPHMGNYEITKYGQMVLEGVGQGVGPSRWGGRKGENLSYHYIKFKLNIINKKLDKARIKKLNPNDYYENKLHNLHQHIIKFDDATIIINPKVVIINIHDLVGKNNEQNDIRTLDKAIEYAKKLNTIGIKTENIMLESGHYARMNSYLSQFLQKINDRYFIETKGIKFWIDNSNDNLEDETNNKEARKKIDNAMQYIMTSKGNLSDIDKIIDALENLTTIELYRYKRSMSQITGKKEQAIRPEYIG